MEKEIKIIKSTNYDEFKCIADKCEFTCCLGWDINIDNNTYDKWKSCKEGDILLKNIKVKGKEYFINKETKDGCIFLNDKGLCNLVIEYGEEFLSETCHTFPRIKNEFENITEFSLNCACPEVVDLLGGLKTYIAVIGEIGEECPRELKVRKVLLDILKNEKYLVEEKTLMGFEMLNSLRKYENNTCKLISDLEKWQNETSLNKLSKDYRSIKLDKEEALEELGNLFFDITENYKEVSNLNHLIDPILSYLEEYDICELSEQWNEFKEKFRKFDTIIINFILSKVISSCVSEDMKENLVTFEMIMLEYLLVRYAVFIKCFMNEKEIDEKDIKDYMVAFSRVIGNNIEAMREFLVDGFESEVLELGYLCFIGLF